MPLNAQRARALLQGMDVDYQPLASNPEYLRWRNAAQWARNTMHQDGLIKGDSAHGTWEITAAGRALLERSERAGGAAKGGPSAPPRG